jgi:tetratricopeptide (TPR) repeat protein
MRLGPVAALALLSLLLTGCPKREEPRADAALKAGKKAAPEIPQQGALAQKVLYEQAKSLLRAGRPAESIKIFRKAIKAHPSGDALANCYLGLGSAYGELRRFKAAVAAYEKVVQLRPSDPAAYQALAIGQEEAGQLKAARGSLEQSLALDADQLSAYQDLAGLYLKDKDLEGAKKTYVRYEFRRTALIKALGLAKSEERREAAGVALGQARDEATAKALGLALTDRSRRVRLAVIRALGQQGLREGVGPLRQLLARTKDAEERRLCQISLKTIASTPQPGPQPSPTAALADSGAGGTAPPPPAKGGASPKPSP